MSGNPNRYMGRAEIRVNGMSLATLDGATFTPSGAVREVVKGYEVYGYSEAPQEAHLEGKIKASSAFSVDDANAIDNATITFKADTGEAWIIPNAWSDGGATLGSNGEIDIKFTGKKSQRTA
ncbi:phage tail tube protein [Citrobacter braakii]|uniref:phage tail tube protein n=1 Tax=Citrobacter braakii TaxID=57706 RepID=UPI00403A2FD3